MRDIVADLLAAHREPFATRYDHRHLLQRAAAEIARLRLVRQGLLAANSSLLNGKPKPTEDKVELKPIGPEMTVSDNAVARCKKWERLGPHAWGRGVAQDMEQIRRMEAELVNWVSEATSVLRTLLDRAGMSDSCQRSLADLCSRVWDANFAMTRGTPQPKTCVRSSTPEADDTPGGCSVSARCTSGKCQDALQKNLALNRSEVRALEWAIGAAEREEKNATFAHEQYKNPDFKGWAQGHAKRAEVLRGILVRGAMERLTQERKI